MNHLYIQYKNHFVRNKQVKYKLVCLPRGLRLTPHANRGLQYRE